MTDFLTIPQAFEAEQAVLGAIIFNNDIFPKIARIIKPGDFFRESHRHIFASMASIVDSGDPINEISIGDNLKRKNKLEDIGSYAYLAELVECVPSSGNPEYYAVLIRQESIARSVIELSSDMGKKARDPMQSISELLIEYQNKLTEITADTTRKPARHIKECLKDNFEELENLTSENPVLSYMPTDFADLDKILTGLYETDLILIAARPGMGKTALALNIIDNIHRKGTTKGASIIYTREMADIQLSKRLLSCHGTIHAKKLKTGELDRDDWDKLSAATGDLSGYPIYIDEHTGNIDQLIFETKNLDQTLPEGVGCVVCDYAQLMEGQRKQNREQEVSYISRKMKLLAKSMGIPVLLLSQLNRAVDARSNKIPQLSDLRESGSLEQDADIILFIYRDEEYNQDSNKKGIADIIIAKHRNGSTGAVELVFQGKYQRFSSISRAQ